MCGGSGPSCFLHPTAAAASCCQVSAEHDGVACSCVRAGHALGAQGAAKTAFQGRTGWRPTPARARSPPGAHWLPCCMLLCL